MTLCIMITISHTTWDIHHFQIPLYNPLKQSLIETFRKLLGNLIFIDPFLDWQVVDCIVPGNQKLLLFDIDSDFLEKKTSIYFTSHFGMRMSGHVIATLEGITEGMCSARCMEDAQCRYSTNNTYIIQKVWHSFNAYSWLKLYGFIIIE